MSARFGCHLPRAVPGQIPLFELDNVILTPYIAGARIGECRRPGCYGLDEFKH